MNENPIDVKYAERHPTSAKLFERALKSIAGGVAHDGRHLSPFPIYVVRASGARKWDADGHDFVDYAMGHGALLLGHGHPTLIRAIRDQTAKGTHYGAGHPNEVRWAELVQEMVPSAELVRFTSSGTEATLMALRLARAHSGREKVLRFEGHFHGWHDYVSVGVYPPYEVPLSKGIPDGALESMVTVPANDIEAVTRALDGDSAIGTVIVEPSGGSWGALPLRLGFLTDLRRVTAERGVLLIFDEIITGFRWSTGGVQGKLGIKPDLTTLAKILAGGLPGGAVAGRADVMERLAWHDDAQWDRLERTYHPGTFNANPLSAASGIAMLETIGDGRIQALCDSMARELRCDLNSVARELGCNACVYGESSAFHFFFGQCQHRGDCTREACVNAPALLGGMRPEITSSFRKALTNNGVDLLGLGGFVSAHHGDQEIQVTANAFRRTLKDMREAGLEI